MVGLLLPGVPLRAQDRTPFPAFDGRRVYVAGVPDNYKDLPARIARLEQGTPQTYYVVVVESAGPRGGSRTKQYANAIFDVWRRQADAKGLPLDPERSIVVVVALGNHEVGVRPGAALERIGLHGDRLNQEVVRASGFLDLARSGKYSEAIAALLNAADRWIAEHDATFRGTRPTEETSDSAPAVTTARPTETTPIAISPASYAPGRSMTGEIAVGLGLSVAVLLLGFLGLIWFIHRRARSRVDRRVKEVRSRATDIMDRLDALKERLKLLPVTDPDFKAPMTGETLALYDRIQAQLGGLWDRWIQVMETVDKAQKITGSVSNPFERKKLEDAESLLEQKGVFEEIEAGARECEAGMDRLNKAHEEARAVLESVGTTRPKIDARVAEIEKLSLPTAPYLDELHAIAAGTGRSGQLLTADPLGAHATLDALRGRADRLLSRLERVVGLFKEAQQSVAALEGVRRQTAEHRKQGLRLDEDGGDPDHFLGQGDQAHAAALWALRSGDPDAAATKLEAARSMVKQAQATIEQVRQARDYCRREQSNRERETQRLAAALPQAESYHRDLERNFAASSWQGVAHNVEQARALLSTFDRLAADAAASATDQSQQYLGGARLLGQLAQQQQIALRLMSGLGERLNALSALRDECRKARGELESTERRVRGYFQQHGAQLGPMARDSLDQAIRAGQSSLSGFNGPRPDWPDLRQGLARALEGFAIAQSQAEADVRIHDQLGREYQQTRGELERVANLLAGRREDRVAANRHFRAAAEVLDRVGLDLSQPGGEWTLLLERVRGAMADINEAERLAREDIRLAAQAQAEITGATRSIRESRAYFAMGITVDTSAAESALDRAAQLLQAQEYEQAIQLAGEAQQQARGAYQRAVQQVSWRQQEADAERRRLQAGSPGSMMGDALSTGAAVAAAVILNQMGQAAAAPPDPGPPQSPEPIIDPGSGGPDTAVSSWESDSSQSTW